MSQANYDGLTLRFDTRKDVHNAATLHRADCQMVTRSPRHVSIITENVAEEVADLEDRAWKVTRCKCCK